MAKRKKDYAIRTATNRGTTAQNILSDFITMSTRQEFLDRFIVCEIVCKTIIEYYQRNTKKGKSVGHIRLNMKTISAAMNYFSLEVQAHVLGGVFGGTGNYKKRGTKSAKKLRDGIMHTANKADILEIYNRSYELNHLMEEFLLCFLPREAFLTPALV